MRRVFKDNANSSIDLNFDFSDDSWSYDLQSLVRQATPQQLGMGQIGTGLGSSLSLSTGLNASSSDASDPRSSPDAPGPLVLLDDDGHLSPVTGASGSGSQTTAGGIQGSAPAATLVGPSNGLQFNLIWDASVSSAPASFMSAVITAATFYTQQFANHEVINVQVGYGEVAGSTIGSGALAESESYGYTETYAQVSAGLRGDASSSSAQATADSTLPSNDPTNGGSFFVSTAEAKALGQVSGIDSNTDGYIGLSSSYSFSFNGSPTSGQFDAIGAMEHELSEVMGRIGSVGSLFGTGVYTPLDLFRYSSAGTRALAAGPGYFSIDNGNSNLGTYNNPLNGGDASDWTPGLAGDSYGSGYPGMSAAVSSNDIVEDSVLGYVLGHQDHPPVVTAPNYTATRNQTIAATGLFSVSDADGDAITAYQFWDSTPDLTSGHWVVGGVAQPAGQAINVTPTQLATATFHSGLASDLLWVRAYDGTEWGAWQSFYVNVPDHAPIVTAPNYTATRGQPIAATSLFSVSDADNDPITAYQFWDSTSDAGSGHWVVGGTAQPKGQAINVTPAQLSTATFQAESGADQLWVRASDGIQWGAWQEFYVTAPVDHAPVVTAADYTASHDQTIAATSLFSVSDGDSDTITAYQFWDSTPDASSGSWVVGGVAEPAGRAINVTPAQLASTTFQSGSGSDHLWVRAFDGVLWSDWASFNVNAPVDHAPVVTGSNAGLTLNTSLAASNLFGTTDADSDTIKTYELWDSVNSASNGHFLLSGAVQPSGQGIFLDASQFSQTSFIASSTPTTDRLWERAFDGSLWSDWTAVSVTSHA